MATFKNGNVSVTFADNYTPSDGQTVMYNAIGRNSGFNPLGWIGDKINSAENAFGTTISAGVDMARSGLFGGTKGNGIENISTENMLKRQKESIDDVYRKYGFNSKQDFDDQLYSAENSGNQAEADRLLNIAGLNDELKSVANANATEAKNKADAYQDYRKNSYIGQKVNQNNGKFAGSALNTLSTMADIAGMATGAPFLMIPNRVIGNGIQGAIGGVANELEQNGGNIDITRLFDKGVQTSNWDNFDWGRAGQNALIGGASGLASGAFNNFINGKNFIGGSGDWSKLANKAIQSQIGRGALSGAVGGAVGGGLGAGLNGGDWVSGAMQGAGQGALSGAVNAGVMQGATKLGGSVLNKVNPQLAQKIADNQKMYQNWRESGKNFNERLTNTLNSGESGLGNWLNRKSSSKLLNRIGETGVGLSIKPVGNDNSIIKKYGNDLETALNKARAEGITDPEDLKELTAVYSGLPENMSGKQLESMARNDATLQKAINYVMQDVADGDVSLDSIAKDYWNEVRSAYANEKNSAFGVGLDKYTEQPQNTGALNKNNMVDFADRWLDGDLNKANQLFMRIRDHGEDGYNSAVRELSDYLGSEDLAKRAIDVYVNDKSYLANSIDTQQLENNLATADEQTKLDTAIDQLNQLTPESLKHALSNAGYSEQEFLDLLTNNNAHTERVLAEALLTGNEDYINRAKQILNLQASDGYLTPNNKAFRDELIKDIQAYNNGQGITQGTGSQSVRDWYMKNYADDDLGGRINQNLTFDQLKQALQNGVGGDIYNTIGVQDSVIRERLFNQLVNEYGGTYGDYYDQWINGGNGTGDSARIGEVSEYIDPEIQKAFGDVKVRKGADEMDYYYTENGKEVISSGRTPEEALANAKKYAQNVNNANAQGTGTVKDLLESAGIKPESQASPKISDSQRETYQKWLDEGFIEPDDGSVDWTKHGNPELLKKNFIAYNGQLINKNMPTDVIPSVEAYKNGVFTYQEAVDLNNKGLLSDWAMDKIWDASDDATRNAINELRSNANAGVTQKTPTVHSGSNEMEYYYTEDGDKVLSSGSTPEEALAKAKTSNYEPLSDEDMVARELTRNWHNGEYRDKDRFYQLHGDVNDFDNMQFKNTKNGRITTGANLRKNQLAKLWSNSDFRNFGMGKNNNLGGASSQDEFNLYLSAESADNLANLALEYTNYEPVNDWNTDRVNRMQNGGKTQSSEANPQTAKDWAKRAIKRIGEDLDNKGVGLSIKPVDNTPSDEQTEVYRTLMGGDGSGTGDGTTPEEFESGYGQSKLATGETRRSNFLSRAGRALEASQAGGTRKENRDIGIENAGDLINTVRKRTGISDIETQAQLARELTGGKDSLLDNIQRQALTATEDGSKRTVDLTDLNKPIEDLIYNASGVLLPDSEKQKLFVAVIDDLTNNKIDTITKANNMRAVAHQLYIKDARTPDDSSRLKANILSEIAGMVEDKSYKAVPKDNVDAMFETAQQEALSRAKVATQNGKKNIAKAYTKLANEIENTPHTISDFRHLKKDFVDISKLYTKTSQGATAWNSYSNNAIIGSAIAGAFLSGNPLTAIPTAVATKMLAPAIGESANTFGAKIGGKIADLGDMISDYAVRPTTPATDGQTVLYNALGRENGLNPTRLPQTDNESAYVEEVQTAPVDNAPVALLASSGNVASDVYTPSTDETAVYDSLANSGTTTNSYTTPNLTTSQATGNDFASMLQRAMQSASEAGDAQAFGTLYQMYQNAISKNSSDMTNPVNWNSADRTKLINAQNGLSQIDTLANAYVNATGNGGDFVSGNLRNFGNMISGGNLDPTASNYNDLAQSVGMAIIKNLVNLGVTESDAERYKQYLPALTDSAEKAQMKLETLRRLYQDQINNLYSTYNA